MRFLRWLCGVLAAIFEPGVQFEEARDRHAWVERNGK